MATKSKALKPRFKLGETEFKKAIGALDALAVACRTLKTAIENEIRPILDFAERALSQMEREEKTK